MSFSLRYTTIITISNVNIYSNQIAGKFGIINLAFQFKLFFYSWSSIPSQKIHTYQDSRMVYRRSIKEIETFDLTLLFASYQMDEKGWKKSLLLCVF